MALFAPSESPAVIVKEIDLTGTVPNVQSSTGAYVGRFRWGATAEVRLITNEAGLVDTFASPDDAHSVDFHSASYFLRYSNSLKVVRMHNGANNAHGGASYDSNLSIAIGNQVDFDTQEAQLNTDNVGYVAKYPGTLGNSLAVHTFALDSAGSTAELANWTYGTHFNVAPTTSQTATDDTATHDEVHVVVVDEDGKISGTKGAVLETYEHLSVASNGKNTDGSTNYFKEVINRNSKWLWVGDPTQTGLGSNAGSPTSPGLDFKAGRTTALRNFSMADGDDGSALTTSNVLAGYDKYEDVNTQEVDFLIAPGMLNASDQQTVVNDLVATASSLRKDCVAVTSPDRAAVVANVGSEVTSSVSTAANFTKSSYLVVDNQYLKVFDKYNDKFIQIPAASSTAGLMAATDRDAAPFFSPAGTRRGKLLGVTSLAYEPVKADRDTLYKAGINPITNMPGEGIILFGDKTHETRPSAFDRINVRRLFLVLERAIARAARQTIFEFNDEFTRANFRNIVEPFLREVQGRRGITDFLVVCDETNNTGEVIDRNEFIAEIFVKPARSINFITLQFIATRTGVSFDEVAG